MNPISDEKETNWPLMRLFTYVAMLLGPLPEHSTVDGPLSPSLMKLLLFYPPGELAAKSTAYSNLYLFMFPWYCGDVIGGWLCGLLDPEV